MEKAQVLDEILCMRQLKLSLPICLDEEESLIAVQKYFLGEEAPLVKESLI